MRLEVLLFGHPYCFQNRRSVGPFKVYLCNSYVRSLQPFGALLDGELNPLILLEGAESSVLDGAVMDKNILTELARDESIAFCVIEPFNGSSFSFCHVLILLDHMY